MMVMQYAREGSLRGLIKSKDKLLLRWDYKLRALHEIIYALMEIHKTSYVHHDLHPGNILSVLNTYSSNNSVYKMYISDFGLSQNFDVKDDKGIYGVLPYLPPEVLCGKPYTKEADIYSFGMIMAEIATRKLPYHDIPHNNDLAIKIVIGKRPKFSKGTPEIYIDITNRCLNSDPKKRPTADEIEKKIYSWLCSIWYPDDEERKNIKEIFDRADERQEQYGDDFIHPEANYTSKFVKYIDFQQDPTIPKQNILKDPSPGKFYIKNIYIYI